MVKSKIRKSLFEQGHALSEEFIFNSNKTIQVMALETLDITNIKNVLLYSPFRKEIKLDIILKELNKALFNSFKIISNLISFLKGEYKSTFFILVISRVSSAMT